ncbi:PREDICTED: uncharacterized protein LOC105565605 [Vollenhovia emeryi]|uniref:uncharacterized protein LOC105565605 n=1 Tax=Vollenhovia emeryi TaxID=411798 RepID=UPI0005F52195|nr:PREDICTED: uncharacterized protein LOC105565605 [Vollenhovia emeryi]XP_011874323.1 PREDICTED: uncharacterized protein LOC105565605 [Vollenhovia emeryi]
MTAGEASISLNENVQRVIDDDDIVRVSGVQEQNRGSSNSREGALNHPFLNESSWLRIDRSPPRERQRQRRRWKLRHSLLERRTTRVLRDIRRFAHPWTQLPGKRSIVLRGANSTAQLCPSARNQSRGAFGGPIRLRIP